MERYLAAARAHGIPAAVAELSDDVVMRNPATDDVVVGREAVAGALNGVQAECDEFVHTHLLEPGSTGDTRLYGLGFEARIGEARLQGADLVELDADDQICSFTALARPVASLMALGSRMAEHRSTADEPAA